MGGRQAGREESARRCWDRRRSSRLSGRTTQEREQRLVRSVSRQQLLAAVHKDGGHLFAHATAAAAAALRLSYNRLSSCTRRGAGPPRSTSCIDAPSKWAGETELTCHRSRSIMRELPNFENCPIDPTKRRIAAQINHPPGPSRGAHPGRGTYLPLRQRRPAGIGWRKCSG